MANIKICDRDGEFFPEDAIGSGVIQSGYVIKEDDSGSKFKQNLKADLCPKCVSAILSSGKQTIALTAQHTTVPDAEGTDANEDYIEGS